MPISSRKKLNKNELLIKKTVREGLKRYPDLVGRVFQQFLILLHSRGIISIDEIYQRVDRRKAARLNRLSLKKFSDNIHTPSRWTKKEEVAIQRVVMQAVAVHFTQAEVEDVIRMVVRREEVKNLEDLARLHNVSFDLLAQRVKEFCRLPETSIGLPMSDIIATRVCLLHHFISDQLDYLGIAKKYIRIRDLNIMAQNTIGPRRGIGRIGGKAAGMILANRIIETQQEELKKTLEFPLRFPESYYLRSDLYLDFMKRNGFIQYYDQKYRSIDLIEKEYPVIKEIFKNGSFSDDIMAEFKKLLKKIGKRPFIVRSSSLLEDNFGSAFCGKYRSIYVANQGSEKKNLQELIGAITEVYASIMHPDPISYRRKRNLLDYDEMMAILIQPVIGKQFGKYYFPLYSGVAFSRNDYRWSRRIRREDGMIRMVMGLGTRAVDRVSSDYPRIIALTEPTLRPQGTTEDIIKYSQRHLDVVNLQKNSFETIRLQDLPIDTVEIDHFDRIVSIWDEGHLSPAIGRFVDAAPEKLCITFDKLISSTSFIDQLKQFLKQLEKDYGCPVDVEFTFDGQHLYILQCRPLSKQIAWERVQIPDNIPQQQLVFTANRDVQNGTVEDIEYLVYVPAPVYEQVSDYRRKQRIGRVIGGLNQKLANNRFILMGPGRWGSTDINLGVRVFYSDISNTKALIEVAHAKNGYVPEVSFGTHFFQDLVEGNIFYLPLYPDDQHTMFNNKFLDEAPNSLASLLPEFADMEEMVRVIDIRKVCPDQKLHLFMDGESVRAVACLLS
jgi:hypothetical protein